MYSTVWKSLFLSSISDEGCFDPFAAHGYSPAIFTLVFLPSLPASLFPTSCSAICPSHILIKPSLDSRKNTTGLLNPVIHGRFRFFRRRLQVRLLLLCLVGEAIRFLVRFIGCLTCPLLLLFQSGLGLLRSRLRMRGGLRRDGRLVGLGETMVGRERGRESSSECERGRQGREGK